MATSRRGKASGQRVAPGPLTTAVVVSALALASAVVSWGAARSSTPLQLVAHGDLGGTLGAAAVVGVGAVLVAAAWLGAWWRPSTLPGLSLAALGALLPVWSAWPQLPDAGRAATLAAGPLTVLAAARLAASLEWRAASRVGSVPRVLTPTVVLLVVVAVLLRVATYDPFADPRCADLCSHVAPVLAGHLGTRTGARLADGLVVIAALLVISRSLLRGRAGFLSPSVGVVAAALLMAGGAIERTVSWNGVGRGPGPAAAPLAAALVLAATVLGRMRRTARIRGPLQRLARRLAEPELVNAMSGPVRAVQFVVPGESTRWVDSTGASATELPDLHPVVLHDADSPVVRLLLSRAEDEPEVLDGLDGVTRFALRNGQLSSVAKARLADVRESQRRVVTASDAERSRIERDLHDGAQQRLVTVALHLRLAMSGADGAAAAALLRAESDVRQALSELRRLAHGIYPGALLEEGLVVALEELALNADVPLVVSGDLTGSLPPGVAMAAYAVAASGIELAAQRSTRTMVDLHRDEAALKISIHVPGIPSAHGPEQGTGQGTGPGAGPGAEVVDRVGALGGTVTATRSDEGALDLCAVIPCA